MIIRGASLLTVMAVTLCATSCGTILYPDRRGQSAGQIDAGVAVLDGLGLLFFLIPGVIAFAVDFTTGAIYLPSHSSQLQLTSSDLQDARRVQTDPTSLTRSEIESVVARQTGQEITLASSATKVAKVGPEPALAWGGIADVLTPSELAAFNHDGTLR